MNIAMFAWEAMEGLSVGGGALYASRLAAALARAGHRVRLFTRLGEGQAMDEVVGGVNVRRCPWDRKRGFFDEIEALADSFAHYYADALKNEGPYDIVHCHEWLSIRAGLKALALEPSPRLAVSFQSTEWGRTGIWPDAGDSARIAGLEREGIARADAVITSSFWAKRMVLDQFHPPDWKCEVVYHGVDLPDVPPDMVSVLSVREATGIGLGTPTVLFAGRFSASGGGDLAARACRLVAERFPEARFLFIGAGPMEEEMRSDAGQSACFIPLTGRVVPAEFYHAANLVLAPFRRDHNGRAVLPAWLAAKPAAVLKNTVPAEFIVPEANGWTVAEDPEELAAVVMTALGNPEMTGWMGRNGRAAAETAFSWDESARRLVAAYNRREQLSPSP